MNGSDARAGPAAETQRILALEVRPQRFAFAVFERSLLLDFGGHVHRWDPASAASRVSHLIALFTPSVVITRETRKATHESAERAAIVWKTINAALTDFPGRIEILERGHVADFFAEQGCTSKMKRALWLVRRFSELRSRLPRERKRYHREAYGFALFDAVATAVASGFLSNVSE